MSTTGSHGGEEGRSPKKSGGEITPKTYTPEIEETKEKIKQRIIRSLEVYSGPIPSPELFEKYKQVDPALPKAIISSFLDHSTTTQEIRKKQLKYDFILRLMGIVSTCLMTIVALISDVIIAISGSIALAVFIFLTVAGLIALALIIRGKESGEEQTSQEPEDRP